LVQRLRDNARELAKREFTREACAQAFSALYGRLLKRPSAALAVG